MRSSPTLFALGSATVVLVAVACSNSYTDTKGDLSAQDASVVVPSASDAAASPERVCGDGKKLCSGECVAMDDPRYGCAAESCEPCALTNTKVHSCNAAGKCSVEQCASGWDYCHLDQGCTVDPLSPDTCGGCAVRGGKNCGAQEVCSEGLCKNTCAPVAEKTITNCNRSCVDLSTHPRHCGACATECLPTPGGSAACSASKCAIDCDQNHAHCNGNAGTCESLLPIYADKDGDTWGSTPVMNGTVQKFACGAAAGEAVRGGDCLDDPANPATKNVNPGQTRFFTTSYNAGTAPSFDYNCNGKTDFSAPLFGSCSPCVTGFVGKVSCGVAAPYASCGLIEEPVEQSPTKVGAASQVLQISTLPGGSSSGTVPQCPRSAIPSCR